MKITVSVMPSVLNIADEDVTMKTAIGVRELIQERVNTWLATEAQVVWEIEQVEQPASIRAA